MDNVVNLPPVVVLSSNEIPSEFKFDSIYDIENAIVALNKINHQIDFLKELKKNRVACIEEEIKKYTGKEEWLRELVARSMKDLAPKEKTLTFPGVGKVTRRNVKGGWEIVDEPSLVGYLEQKGLKDGVMRVKESLDTKKAKALIEQMVQQNVELPGVQKKLDSESLSVTFEELKEELKEEAEDLVSDTKSIEELDSLES